MKKEKKVIIAIAAYLQDQFEVSVKFMHGSNHADWEEHAKQIVEYIKMVQQ